MPLSHNAGLAGHSRSKRDGWVSLLRFAAVNNPSPGPSRTAMLTAVARAIHLEEPPPWIFDDPFALELAGDEGNALRELLRAELPEPNLLAFSRWVCVRARFSEDIVEDAVGNGIRQYVILGAGLDSFSYRRGDLLERLRVFEVDQPVTQSWKRRRLAEIGVQGPTNLVFAPLDFEHETLAEGLTAAGFDFDEPAVFSWIGVTMYLTLEAITTTLATIAECPAGTRVVLTHNQPKEALQGMGAELESVLARIVTEMGEPMVSLFTPSEIEELLREFGFDDIVLIGPQEALAAYFKGREDVRLGGAQRLVAATVSG
jgi:methyltransferase (TIGR00027 family)